MDPTQTCICTSTAQTYTVQIKVTWLRRAWEPGHRRHVIIETNNTTARIFPSVPDCETPEFWCAPWLVVPS